MEIEDIISAENYFQGSNSKQEILDLISVIERACGESSTEGQKEKIETIFNEKLPKYKAIREKLLVAGGYDIQKVKN